MVWVTVGLVAGLVGVFAFCVVMDAREKRGATGTWATGEWERFEAWLARANEWEKRDMVATGSEPWNARPIR